MNPSIVQTELQEEEQRLAELEADIRRHRVMKGHPPTGPIFPIQSEEETARRIKELSALSKTCLDRLQKEGKL